MKKFLVLLLLSFWNGLCVSQDTTGTIVNLTEKIGSTIDLEERNFYKLFQGIKNFESAILLQRKDGSYLFKINSIKENDPVVSIDWFPCAKEEIERVRMQIDPDYKAEVLKLQRIDSTQKKSIKTKGPAFHSGFITEFGYCYGLTPPLKAKSVYAFGYPVSHTNEWKVTGHHYLISELGYIHNLNAKYGLGVTHYTGWNIEHNLHGGLKLRIRRLLNQKTCLDFSIGTILWGVDSGFDRPVFIGDVGLNLRDISAVILMIQILETHSDDDSYYSYYSKLERSFSPRRRNVGVSLGFKLGSKPGLALNALSLTAAIFVLILLISSYSGD